MGAHWNHKSVLCSVRVLVPWNLPAIESILGHRSRWILHVETTGIARRYRARR